MESLPDGVSRTRDGVRWRDVPTDQEEVAQFLRILSLSVVVFGIGWTVSLLSGDATWAHLVLAAVMPLGVVGIAVAVARMWGTTVQVRANRIERAGRCRWVGTLEVVGEPGEALELRDGKQVVASFDRGWTVAACDAFVRAVGEVTPMRDGRDRALWARWAADPDFRAQQQLERRLRENEAAFPALAGVEAVPVREQPSLDRRVLEPVLYARNTSGRVELAADVLRAPGLEMSRDRVVRAYILLGRAGHGSCVDVMVWDGRTSVLVGRQSVAERHGVARARGMAEAIEQWARRENGDRTDVPEQLSAMLRA